MKGVIMFISLKKIFNKVFTQISYVLLGIIAIQNSYSSPTIEDIPVPKEDHFVFIQYKNDRFNYQILYPTLLIPGPSPTNGDGLSFLNKDKSVKLSVHGSFSIDFNTAEFISEITPAYQESLKEFKEASGGNEPTYKKVSIKNRWFVISGYIGKNIYYQKTFITQELDGDSNFIVYVKNTFNITYPSSKRELYDPIVEVISKSFRTMD